MTKAKAPIKLNVTYQLKDSEGNIKPLFQPYNFIQKLIKSGMTKAKAPIKLNVTYQLKDSEGNVKPLFQPYNFIQKLIKSGWISPSLKIPVLLGFYQNQLKVSNLITNAGLAGLASRINGSGAVAAFTYIALGIGSTAANVADTELDSEVVTVGGERANATASRVTTVVTNDTARLNHEFTFSGSLALVESGVLNAGSAGVLLARQVFSAINVGSGDSLDVTWDFQTEDAG